MRTRRKKHIRVPIASRADTDGAGMRPVLFVLAILIIGGLIYIYAAHPDVFAQLTHLEVGKMNTIGAPPRL